LLELNKSPDGPSTLETIKNKSTSKISSSSFNQIYITNTFPKRHYFLRIIPQDIWGKNQGNREFSSKLLKVKEN